MTNEHDRKLKDLELLQGKWELSDEFNSAFEDLSLDREFWGDPERCKLAKHLIFKQGEFLGRELGREALRMDGPGNN